jgi:hypothetical protein
VKFIDDNGVSVITGENDRLGTRRSDNAEPADLDVTIRFMAAVAQLCQAREACLSATSVVEFPIPNSRLGIRVDTQPRFWL